MTAPSPHPGTAPLTRDEVRDAAHVLVEAFASTNTAAYFACFASDADFVFHTEPTRVRSRAAYEKLWTSWMAEGWRVTACQSTDVDIRLLGNSAVFAHDVLTTTLTDGQATTVRERETIVFARTQDGTVLAVHEHLSPAPEQNGHES